MQTENCPLNSFLNARGREKDGEGVFTIITPSKRNRIYHPIVVFSSNYPRQEEPPLIWK